MNPAAAPAPPKARTNSGVGQAALTRTPVRRWQILPFSFLFLLLGLFLGILSAVIIGPQMGQTVANPYALGLRAEQLGGTSASGITKVQLFWNRSAQSISGAVDGTLYIEDGGANKKVVPLSRAQLQGQTVVYDMSNRTVHFRLDVRMSESNVFSESLDFRAR